MKHQILLWLAILLFVADSRCADDLAAIQSHLDAEQLRGIKAFVISVPTSGIKSSEDMAPTFKLLHETIKAEFSKVGIPLLSESQLTKAQLLGAISLDGISYTQYEIGSFLCYVSDAIVAESADGSAFHTIRRTNLSLNVLCPNPRIKNSNLWAVTWETSFYDASKKPGINGSEIVSATRDFLMRFLAANRAIHTECMGF